MPQLQYKYMLNPNAKLKHETAREWYESYGWHLSTELAGDVELQAVTWEWAELDTETAIANLMESDSDLSYDEAQTIVVKAKEVREAAEPIVSYLELAVDCYKQGDLDGVTASLDVCRGMEMDHGDCPASNALRADLLMEDPRTVIKLFGGDLGSETLLVRCDLSRAESPVQVDYMNDKESTWESTQWQCGDTRHTKNGLAALGETLAAQAVGMSDDDFECEWAVQD